jgi:hypothetical protein
MTRHRWMRSFRWNERHGVNRICGKTSVRRPVYRIQDRRKHHGSRPVTDPLTTKLSPPVGPACHGTRQPLHSGDTAWWDRCSPRISLFSHWERTLAATSRALLLAAVSIASKSKAVTVRCLSTQSRNSDNSATIAELNSARSLLSRHLQPF